LKEAERGIGGFPEERANGEHIETRTTETRSKKGDRTSGHRDFCASSVILFFQ